MLKSQKQRKIFRRDRGVVVYFDSPKYPIQDFMLVMSCKKIIEEDLVSEWADTLFGRGIFIFLKFGRHITFIMKLFHAKFQINISNSVEMAHSTKI
jgi:hypothetical protein